VYDIWRSILEIENTNRKDNSKEALKESDQASPSGSGGEAV
jgi:hypothetical protein